MVLDTELVYVAIPLHPYIPTSCYIPNSWNTCLILRATNIAILSNKMKTAQQLIGNGRGSIGLIGNCAHMSVKNDHHVAVPVISLWSPCTDFGFLQVGPLLLLL